MQKPLHIWACLFFFALQVGGQEVEICSGSAGDPFQLNLEHPLIENDPPKELEEHASSGGFLFIVTHAPPKTYIPRDALAGHRLGQAPSLYLLYHSLRC